MASVISSSTDTQILDGEVTFGALAENSAGTSADTFTLRQNRAVAFSAANLKWTVVGLPVEPADNEPPVAIVDASAVVLSFAKVNLDGGLSSDVDGEIESYAWKQLSGPPVDLQSSSEPIAYFTAPSVTNSTSMGFQLAIKDDKGAASSEEINIEVVPVASSDLDVKLIALEYFESNPEEDSHADYFPVAGPPVANEEILCVATLSGLIADVSFELRDPSGNVIGFASLTRMGESSNPPFDYGGIVTIPDEPFLVAAVGNTYDGQVFEVISSTLIAPERYRVFFLPALADLATGEQLSVELLIENGGDSDTFDVELSDPYGLLGVSGNTPRSVEIASGGKESLRFEIVAPEHAPVVSPIPLTAFVVARGDPNKRIGTELLLTVGIVP